MFGYYFKRTAFNKYIIGFVLEFWRTPILLHRLTVTSNLKNLSTFYVLNNTWIILAIQDHRISVYSHI